MADASPFGTYCQDRLGTFTFCADFDSGTLATQGWSTNMQMGGMVSLVQAGQSEPNALQSLTPNMAGSQARVVDSFQFASQPSEVNIFFEMTAAERLSDGPVDVFTLFLQGETIDIISETPTSMNVANSADVVSVVGISVAVGTWDRWHIRLVKMNQHYVVTIVFNTESPRAVGNIPAPTSNANWELHVGMADGATTNATRRFHYDNILVISN